jgi:1-acyl-sn-glycerol-3-phosphate acyltransferase
VLPDTPQKIASWHVLENIIHPPIETAGMSLADLETLKEQTYRTIASAL